MFKDKIKKLFRKWELWRCLKTDCHKRPTKFTFDGVNAKGKCPRCGKTVLGDSQGGWFSINN